MRGNLSQDTDSIRCGVRLEVHGPIELLHLPVQQRDEAGFHLLVGATAPHIHVHDVVPLITAQGPWPP
jgi:hypothetical protein